MTPFEVLVQGWEQTWVEPSLALQTWLGTQAHGPEARSGSGEGRDSIQYKQ